MTDEELLRLAAKAAGHVVNEAAQAERIAMGYGYVGLWTERSTCWNPRNSDGDALKLSVVLELDLDYGIGVVKVSRESPDPRVCVSEDYGTDRSSAVRLAITRAAADIGAKMP